MRHADLLAHFDGFAVRANTPGCQIVGALLDDHFRMALRHNDCIMEGFRDQHWNTRWPQMVPVEGCQITA